MVIKDKKVLLINIADIDYIENKLGEKSAYAIGFNIFSLGKIAIVIPDYIGLDELQVQSFEGTDLEKFNSILGKLSEIDYVVDQSNPTIVWDAGGNCQSISLLLMAYLKENGINSKPVLDDGITHMFVETEINGKSLKVDLVKGVVE